MGSHLRQAKAVISPSRYSQCRFLSCQILCPDKVGLALKLCGAPFKTDNPRNLVNRRGWLFEDRHHSRSVGLPALAQLPPVDGRWQSLCRGDSGQKVFQIPVWQKELIFLNLFPRQLGLNKALFHPDKQLIRIGNFLKDSCSSRGPLCTLASASRRWNAAVFSCTPPRVCAFRRYSSIHNRPPTPTARMPLATFLCWSTRITKKIRESGK
jgi:hypothetical protein